MDSGDESKAGPASTGRSYLSHGSSARSRGSGAGAGAGAGSSSSADGEAPRKLRTAADMSEDEAALLITGLFRARKARLQIKALCEGLYEKVFDEASGCFFYYNKRTGESVWDKPKALGDDDLELSPRSKELLSTHTSRSGTRPGSAASRGTGATSQLDLDALGAGDVLSLEGFLARHGLLQYKEVLVDDGFDDMEALLGIEAVDMDAIGMRTGHKRKLMRAIREIDRTPRFDDDIGSTGGRPPTGAERSKKHRDSMANKLKLDLRRAGGGGGAPGSRRSTARSSLSGSRRRSLYSDDRSAASHRSGRLIPHDDAGMSMASSKDEDDLEMQLETVFEGDGVAFPAEGQVVRCHYTGSFEDGTVFEGSRKRGRAFQFKLGVGQVIEAWDIAVSQMSKGQRAKFTAPPELAYGVEGRPPIIPANATLVFEVELIDFFDPEVELTPREYYDDDVEPEGPPDSGDELG